MTVVLTHYTIGHSTLPFRGSCVAFIFRAIPSTKLSMKAPTSDEATATNLTPQFFHVRRIVPGKSLTARRFNIRKNRDFRVGVTGWLSMAP
jgi:hypothetical protein